MSGNNKTYDAGGLGGLPPAIVRAFMAGWREQLAGAGYAAAYEALPHAEQFAYESGRLAAANSAAVTGFRREHLADCRPDQAEQIASSAAAAGGDPIPPDWDAVA